MRIAQVGDEAKINDVMNDPSVRPHIASGDCSLDVTGLIDKNIYFVSDGCAFTAIPIGDGEYVAGSAAKPECRGLMSVSNHKMAMREMFTKHDAVCLYARIEDDNQRAIRNIIGLKWNVRKYDGFCVASLNVHEWCASYWHPDSGADVIAEQSSMESTKELIRCLRAFVEIVSGGWPGKALAAFNRNAMLLGFDIILPAHEDLDIYTFDGVLFEVKNGSVSILNSGV